jgi:ABC-type Mn2+/Zn2+ transport system ATPase subunit
MNKLCLDLTNCYGIKKLQAQFDFSSGSTYAIYAPNGSMKSSLARTFRDVTTGTGPKDRYHPNLSSSSKITDENGRDLPKESILVVDPYDREFDLTDRTSTLLVNRTLRDEYAQLLIEIDASKKKLLKALGEQSASKKDLGREISLTFTNKDDNFLAALLSINGRLLAQVGAPFADVPYDTIFDQTVLEFLETKDFRTVIADYVKRYDKLLASSTYFKKGTFDYYNGTVIAKSLDDNGFFAAKHTVNLNADERREITSQKQFQTLIDNEKKAISEDDDLRKKLVEVEKLLMKNAIRRDFAAYLSNHEELLPELANVEDFKKRVWLSYLKAQIGLYDELIAKYQTADRRLKEIEQAARTQRTQWEQVIEIFNSRFAVPFELTVMNRTSVVLGQESMPTLGFTIKDDVGEVSIEKDTLMQALSTGEQRAFYLLNAIFEIEARKKENQETLLIADDIADSFDYKNKYAIIQYLADLAEEAPGFRQIILTHNFDFFRTIESREVVCYSHCLMASKGETSITLERAKGIKNPFVNEWKPKFFTDPRKRIASIPFLRNLIEYTRGQNDPGFVKLTSLLHWKPDSAAITHNELDDIYKSVCHGSDGEQWRDGTSLMIDSICSEADNCLKAADGINFENKIVLSIATRLIAERFMVDKIADSTFLSAIRSNQTPKLLDKFKELHSSETDAINAVKQVILMTPENIHLNSFMYEPILDMSDEHLRKLYQDVKQHCPCTEAHS